MTPTPPAAVLVLAAGEGTRMRSATPKVLHEIGGRPLLGYAVAAARALSPDRLAVVVGHAGGAVRERLAALDPAALAVEQAEQRGTGHAVRVALQALDATRPVEGTVLVTYGDVPLLRPETLRALCAAHEAAGAAATVLSTVLDDPTGYGRLLRDPDGAVRGIVEERDADAGQRALTEVSSGVVAFDVAALRPALHRLGRGNAQGEEYLTDVVGLLRAEGRAVAAVRADPAEVLGVNDRVQLATVRRLLNDRLLVAWMRAGVTVEDPATTWVDVTVTLEPDVTLRPNTQLLGATRVQTGAVVGPDCTLRDTVVGPGARVVRAQCEGAQVGPQVSVGPFAYLRPGTVLQRAAKVGTFVETKNAELGPGARVPHLSYVGDASIGEETNIGAATVFVNYDGVDKHRTTIGRHCRTGADNMFVAPVTVGDGAYTAAGSVITEDVPPGAMGVGRARQRNVVGWVQRRRPGTPAAAAASAALAAAPEGAAAPDTGNTGRGDGEESQP